MIFGDTKAMMALFCNSSLSTVRIHDPRASQNYDSVFK